MSKELTTVTIHGTELPIKEYQGERVVTLKEIDAVHRRPEGTARKRFHDNRKHFIKGTDYFMVKCSEVRPFFGQTTPNGFNPNADVTLITESGYLMLVKSFTDDLAWDVQRQLVNSYFRVRQTQPQAAELGKLVEQLAVVAASMAQAVSLFATAMQNLEAVTQLRRASKSQSIRGFVEDCQHPDMTNLLSNILSERETTTEAWRASYHPGPRKKVVSRPPAASGQLRIETFPAEVRQAVDEMMEQMMEEQALNFSEIARYCNRVGCMISSPSVRRYYDKYFNR